METVIERLLHEEEKLKKKNQECPPSRDAKEEVMTSIATGPDDPNNLGQTGHILTGSLGYPDITKITGLSGL